MTKKTVATTETFYDNEGRIVKTITTTTVEEVVDKDFNHLKIGDTGNYFKKATAKPPYKDFLDTGSTNNVNGKSYGKISVDNKSLTEILSEAYNDKN